MLGPVSVDSFQCILLESGLVHVRLLVAAWCGTSDGGGCLPGTSLWLVFVGKFDKVLHTIASTGSGRLCGSSCNGCFLVNTAIGGNSSHRLGGHHLAILDSFHDLGLRGHGQAVYGSLGYCCSLHWLTVINLNDCAQLDLIESAQKGTDCCLCLLPFFVLLDSPLDWMRCILVLPFNWSNMF